MVVNSDNAGNNYVDVELFDKEIVRISFVEKGWNNQDCMRINKKKERKHLVTPCIEIPLIYIGNFIAAITQLRKQ